MFDFVLVTPEEAHEKGLGQGASLDDLKRMAANTETCFRCNNPVWRIHDSDMCFACIVGSTDASQDYELVESKIGGNK